MASTTNPAPLRLHLGCHRLVAAGWQNLDRSPNIYLSRTPALRGLLVRAGFLSKAHAAYTFPPGAIHADVREGLEYPDDSVEYIYSSHMIEHLPRWQALDLARECARVLQPHGVLRLATPDLRRWVEQYVSGDASDGPTPADTLMQRLGMFYDVPAGRIQRFIRRVVSAAPHQWLYDSDSLAHLLREAGFARVEKCEYQKGSLPDLGFLEQIEDSLFVEARLGP